MNELSAEQLAAVTSDAPSTVVLASPATGKTHCLIARIQHLVKQGIDPATIVAISFTNTAANEIRKRLGSVQLGYCGTLHSWMLTHLKWCYHEASVMDEESAAQLLETICVQLKYNGTKKTLEAMLAKGMPTSADKKHLAGLVVHDFYESQWRNRAFSFDSLLVFGHGLVSLHKNRFAHLTHLIVDEYQDTSAWDAVIYRDVNIPYKWFCGDPDQNLFSFRGSDVRHILELTQTSKVFTLETNYRSDVAICEAAQSLIEHNTNRYKKRTVPFSPARGHVTVTSHSTAEEELLKLAQNIRDQQEAGTPLKEMAVLVRTNNLVSHFSEGLKAFSIAVCERSEARLPEDWKRTMLLLSVITSPNNDFLMKRWMEGVEEDATAVNAIAIQARAAFKSINRMTVNWPDNPPAARALGSLVVNGLSPYSHDIINVALATLPPDATASDLLVELRSNPPMATAGSVDGVYVGTVHSAKGREWDNVFLPAFEDEIIPGHKVDQIEDERRIAYVALTRARHFIGISWSELRYMPWRPVIQFHHASRFIAECGIATS